MTGDNKTLQQLGEEFFAGISTEKAEELSARLHRMIEYGIKRQDWYEEQRTKVLTLALALLGLSSFLVSGLLSASTMDYFRIFAGATLIAIALTAFFIIYEYAHTANEEYTHRNLADIRSWYFKYVMKSSVTDAAIYNVNKDEANRKELEEGWKKFVQGWKEYQEKPSGFLIEDLQQVFILFLFQSMRRTSLRKMVTRAYIGGMIIAFFLIPTIITAVCRI